MILIIIKILKKKIKIKQSQNLTNMFFLIKIIIKRNRKYSKCSGRICGTIKYLQISNLNLINQNYQS